MTALLDSKLYWSLPGPAEFVHRVATRAARGRALLINIPSNIVPGVMQMTVEAIRQAHSTEPIVLDVREGTDLTRDVAKHFGRGLITAKQLAAHEGDATQAVVLRADGDIGQRVCEDFAWQFMQATKECRGNVLMLVCIQLPDQRSDGADGDTHVLTFDGGLTREEMRAYVGIRMIQRGGPGSTSLLREIVTEFAGFDAVFAERLIALDNAQIMSIRDVLGSLAASEQARWRGGNWLCGCSSLAAQEPHVLHDYYIAENGPLLLRQDAASRINRRYWKACLHGLLPWIEERRAKILHVLRNALQRVGPIRLPRGANRFVDAEIEDLEINNIVWLTFDDPKDRGKKVLVPTTEREELAVSVCHATKKVRDAIAHLRAPEVEHVSRLIRDMDQLFHAR